MDQDLVTNHCSTDTGKEHLGHVDALLGIDACSDVTIGKRHS